MPIEELCGGVKGGVAREAGVEIPHCQPPRQCPSEGTPWLVPGWSNAFVGHVISPDEITWENKR